MTITRDKAIAVPSELYIDGIWRAPSNGAEFPTTDPFTGAVWATLPEAGPADVRAATAAARRALDGSWGRASGRDRRRLLLRLASALEGHAEDLAEIESRDNGKLIREMKGQLLGLPDWYEYYAGLADKIRGSSVPLSKDGFFGYTRREPVGVCAAITAWNSPLLLLAWKLAPALAAGCTMVVKPSEHASASTLAFGRVLESADVPAGVVNIVLGGAVTGAALVGDGDVDKVSFTGSVEIGAIVGSRAIGSLKRVTLELGGKSANIVFNDAAIDEAVNGAVAGIFAASGQTCAAGSRLLVQRSIHDAFVDAVAERARAITLGDPLAMDSEMGPLAFAQHRENVERHIATALDEGARLVTGGGRPTSSGLASGYFLEPTVLGAVENSMSVAQQEIFGPVLAVIPFDDEAEAIRIANASSFGLAAGVWTRDVARHRVAAALRVGTVWLNSYRLVSYEMPYGGVGASGVGRENGIEGMDDYLEHKSVWVNVGESARDPFTLG